MGLNVQSTVTVNQTLPSEPHGEPSSDSTLTESTPPAPPDSIDITVSATTGDSVFPANNTQTNSSETTPTTSSTQTLTFDLNDTNSTDGMTGIDIHDEVAQSSTQYSDFIQDEAGLYYTTAVTLTESQTAGGYPLESGQTGNTTQFPITATMQQLVFESIPENLPTVWDPENPPEGFLASGEAVDITGSLYGLDSDLTATAKTGFQIVSQTLEPTITTSTNLGAGSFDEVRFETPEELQAAINYAYLINQPFRDQGETALITFHNIDASGLTLKGAHLGNEDYTGANFSGCTYTDVNFGQSLLSGVDLSNSSFVKGSFFNANLAGANLSGSDFTDSEFSRANFEHANLSGAVFESVAFQNAILPNANLSNSEFNNVSFGFGDFGQANFSSSSFSGGSFDYASVLDANLSNAKFTGVNFARANFEHADLDNSTITDGSFFDAQAFRTIANQLTDDQLQGIKLHDSPVIVEYWSNPKANSNPIRVIIFGEPSSADLNRVERYLTSTDGIAPEDFDALGTVFLDGQYNGGSGNPLS